MLFWYRWWQPMGNASVRLPYARLHISCTLLAPHLRRVHQHHHPLPRAGRSRSRGIAYDAHLILHAYVTRYAIPSSFIDRWSAIGSPRPRGGRPWIDRSVERRASELNRSDGTELSSGNNFRRSFHGGDPDRRITAGGGRVRCSGVDKRRSRMWLVPRTMCCFSRGTKMVRK